MSAWYLLCQNPNPDLSFSNLKWHLHTEIEDLGGFAWKKVSKLWESCQNPKILPTAKKSELRFRNSGKGKTGVSPVIMFESHNCMTLETYSHLSKFRGQVSKLMPSVVLWHSPLFPLYLSCSVQVWFKYKTHVISSHIGFMIWWTYGIQTQIPFFSSRITESKIGLFGWGWNSVRPHEISLRVKSPSTHSQAQFEQFFP